MIVVYCTILTRLWDEEFGDVVAIGLLMKFSMQFNGMVPKLRWFSLFIGNLLSVHFWHNLLSHLELMINLAIVLSITFITRVKIFFFFNSLHYFHIVWMSENIFLLPHCKIWTYSISKTRMWVGGKKQWALSNKHLNLSAHYDFLY